ncbi:NAD-dependent epimerase/dehydratase family protein [Fontibacillus sp. BL9]|uniref:NAD-dependent epimerase/dehydratase family protein n=1 Tax=Fontibacillus sp. BL9 TaxID=3389971 RepID=UPI00397DBC60
MDEGTQLLQGKVILITGASGFTGEHACRYFSALGMQVAAMVRDKRRTPEMIGVTYYTCNLLAADEVRAVVRKVSPDYVLHLGGKNSVPESWKEPILYMESNVLSVLYLLDALRLFPACRVLIVGSRLSVGLTLTDRPQHPYSLSKSLQKVAALSWKELFGQDVILAEPCNLIGPGPSTGFCSLLGRRIVQEERGGGLPPFQVSSRHSRRDFLDVRDAVRGYGFLLTGGRSGEVYQVCSGTERSLEEVTKAMLRLAGSGMTVHWGEARPEDAADILKPHFLENAGWSPRIPFETSLQEVIHYFRAEKGG